MGSIVPTRSEKRDGREIAAKPTFKDTKRWLSNEFYQALNRHTTTEDGDYITCAQAMVQGVVDMAVDPEKDDYVRLAASKFIIEHLEGKATGMTEDTKQEIPKINIIIDNVNIDTVKGNVDRFSSSRPSEDIDIELNERDFSVTEEECE